MQSCAVEFLLQTQNNDHCIRKSWNLVPQQKMLHCKEDVTKHTVMA